MKEISFDAPPTSGLFMQSNMFIRMMLGPVGSGKTTTMMFELMRRAAEQAPALDGVRYTRFAIVRTTLAQLKQTVLRDINLWLGSIVRYKVAENIVVIRIGDIHTEWFMIPLDEPEDQRRLLSMQLTGIWINEFIELDPSLVDAMMGRVGRYPSGELGNPTWYGIIGDSNMPNEGGEWHRLLEAQRAQDWGVWYQPGGMSADAENLNWLTQTAETIKLPLNHPQRLAQGRTYYERLSRNSNKAWIKRYVDAKFGNDPDGTAVYAETFSRSFHIVKGVQLTAPNPESGSAPEYEGGIEPVRGVFLMVGQDFGRNPCSLLSQFDFRGRFLALEEIIQMDMGLETHIIRNLLPRLRQPRYAGLQVVVVGDPSGVAKSPHGEENSFDVLRRHGLAALPAPTNYIQPRIRAVEQFLLGNIGGDPLFKIDEARCPMLIRSFMGLYRYGKTKQGQQKPEPDKTNPWSDISDATQYAALGCSAAMQQKIGRVIPRHYNIVPPFVRKAPPSSAWT